MDKEMFCFKKSWRDMLEGLPDRVKMEVGWAIIEYGLYGRLVDLKPMANSVFGVIKQIMDCDNSQSQGQGDRRSITSPENGKKGGRKPNKPKSDLGSEIGYLGFSDEKKAADDSPRARVIVNNKNIADDNNINNNQKIEKETQKKENEKGAPSQPSPVGEGEKIPEEEAILKEVDARAFISYFNESLSKAKAVIPHRCTYTVKRKTAIEARCREHGKENLKLMVDKAVASAFLNGCNNKGWVATLDWLLRPNNFVKVIEGNYDNSITSAMNGRTSKNNNYGNNCNNEIDPRRGTEVGEYAADEY